MTGTLGRPPGLWRGLLRRVLPDDELAAGIVADLDDEFGRDVRALGRRAARATYRRRVLDIGAYALWDRMRGRPWSRPAGRFSATPQADPASPRSPFPLAVAESLRTWRDDIRFAIRLLRKRLGFTAVITVTIALGVGVNVSIFTLVNEILLRPLAIGNAEHVVDVYADGPTSNGFSGFSYPDFLAYRDGAAGVVDLAAFHGTGLNLGSDARGPQVSATFVTRNYFDVLDARPWQGRAFAPEETIRGGANAAVIVSHGFWQRALGGRDDAVGSSIDLHGTPVTVRGILPPGFSGTFIGFPVDVWLPLPLAEAWIPAFDLADRSQETLEFVGRLRADASIAHARAALANLAGALDVDHPIEGRRRGVGVAQTTGVDHSMRRGVVAFLGMLMAVTGVVLLIVCLNVGNMLMAHAAARRREMATRLALGARRTRLLRQLMTETFALFALGGIAALLVSRWAMDVVGAVIATGSFTLAFDLSIDWRVWTFAMGVTVAAACVTMIVPAREAFTNSPIGALRTAGGQEDRGGTRWRSLFVVIQVVGAVVLMSSAGLFLRSVHRGASLDPGYDAARVHTTALALPGARYDADQRATLMREVGDRLRRQPGIEAVALSVRPPIGVRRSTAEVQVPGVEPPLGARGWDVEVTRVDDSFFTALGVPMLFGRSFDRQDVEHDRRVAIVNGAMARQFWGAGDPVGMTLTLGEDQVTIVGVAADTRYLIQSTVPGPITYLPWPSTYPERVILVTRAAPGVAVSGHVQDVVSGVDASLPPLTTRTVRQQIDASLLPQRAAATVIGLLGSFGLLLAALGLYGVLTHAVERRTKEIAIRMAVGGHPGSVVRMVVGSGFRLVIAGLAVGTILSLLVTPILRTMLVGVEPNDPLTLGAVVTLFAVVALVACLVPARRAVAVDPASVLRSD